MTPSISLRVLAKSDGVRRRLLAATFFLSVFVIVPAAIAGSFFTWNLSPSMPRGLYLLERGKAPERGSAVILPVPDSVHAIVLARGYLPGRASLLKVVVALPGDVACVRVDSLVINGRIHGPVLPHDSVGRPLLPARFCGELSPGTAFVGTPAPFSFDSRYFGAVPLSTLTVVRPLWTF
jgi:conjugative transfer signal peptidase TraF